MSTQPSGVLVGKDESGQYNGFHGWSASHDEDGSSESAPLYLNGNVVALVVIHSKSLWDKLSDKLDANARRLVACWNSCNGISTENLENNIPIKELVKKYNDVIVQRDELLGISAAHQPAPSEKPLPFTDAQLYRLWNNSPQISKDVTSCEGFKRVVRLAEAAHGMAVQP